MTLVCLGSNVAKKHLKCQIQEQLFASSHYYDLPQMWILSCAATASEIQVKPEIMPSPVQTHSLRTQKCGAPAPHLWEERRIDGKRFVPPSPFLSSFVWARLFLRALLRGILFRNPCSAPGARGVVSPSCATMINWNVSDLPLGPP